MPLVLELNLHSDQTPRTAVFSPAREQSSQLVHVYSSFLMTWQTHTSALGIWHLPDSSWSAVLIFDLVLYQVFQTLALRPLLSVHDLSSWDQEVVQSFV